MSAPAEEARVGDQEWLARYVFSKRHVRGDGTVKPDAFIPYNHVELSVTRHLQWSEEEIWAAGEKVASKRSKLLQGRADIQADTFLKHRLRVEPAPLPDNSNHANVLGWPPEKQDQKAIALEVVKQAQYRTKPQS